VQGLREAWASYGYEPSDVPGLPRCPDPITKRFSLNNDSGAELPQVEHESMLSDDAASVAAESIHSNPYVFLVGCPRSGTTLLQRMVDAHPQLAITHELHWIPRYFNDRVGLTPEGNVTPHLIPSLLEHKRFSMAQLGITQEELQGLVAGEAPVSFASFVTRLFTLYGRRRGKSFAGDKTPGYVKELPTLHALWPWAKFVHIIRDGRDVCLSMLQWSEQDQFTGRLTTWTEDPVSTLALWWQLHVHLGREAGEVLGPGVYYEVHYEDLVARPGEVCARLCAFLDVPYDEAMLRFHEGRTRANPGLDAKDAWQPVTAGLSDWKAQMPAEEVERFEAAAGGLLAQLKYPRGCPDPSPEAVRQAARIRHLYRSDAKRAN